LASRSPCTSRRETTTATSATGTRHRTTTRTRKVTTLSLVDQDGKPLANQRIILRTGGEGGDERTVVLDATGSIDIPGTDPFDIIFPDLADTQKS
jgi:hypothetical protein